MRLKLFILILFNQCVLIAIAQDLSQSQYFSNLLLLNPAYAGNTENYRINGFFRIQSPLLTTGIKSYGFTFDTYLEEVGGSVGVIMQNEELGAMVTPSANVIYSYNYRAWRELYVSNAIQIGFYQKYLRLGMLDEIPIGLDNGYNSSKVDVHIGSVGYFRNWFFGLSIYYLLKPFDIFEVKDPTWIPKFSFHAGYQLEFLPRLIKQTRILVPTILIQQDAVHQDIEYGAYYQYNSLIGGLFMRQNIYFEMDAAIILVGYKTKDTKITYSYDINLMKKTGVLLDAHEVSIVRLFDVNTKKKPKKLKCPSFLQ